MTEYYTNKSDFEQGKRIGWFEDNVSQVKDLLKDISETAEIVKDNDLSHLYIAQGGATLGKDMPEKTFVDSEHKILDMMEEMKRVHREIVQNIENKYISGLEDAMEALNKINEGKNKYKSEHLTYEETYTYQTSYQTGYGIQTVKGKRKAYYSLSDILNSDKSPISSAAAKYQDKLKVAKENLAKLEAEDKETYDKVKDLSEKELVETFFPTELGEYKRLKSTWSKDNEWWLGWVDIGVKVVGTAALVVGTFASGGTLAPVALALGTTLLGGEAAYRAISGETITGDVLTNEQRIWAGAEAVTTLVSGGLGSYLKGASIAERTVSQGLLNADKVARFGANAYDVAQFGHDFIEDPQMALTNLATSQLIGRTVGHLGQRFQAYRVSKTADVNLGSGKAASYKGSIRERLGNSWTNVKTKVGNVRAQASQGWDDFKMKTANKMNQTLASGGEKLSKKLDNLNAKWGTQKQNFQRNLAAMQGGLVPEFQLAGGAPGIGVNPNFSESMENLSQKIQQFSVKRRQQIQDFEGRGGGNVSHKIDSEVSSGNGRSVYGPYYDEAVKRHSEKPDWYADPDESKIISEEELSDARIEYQQMVRRGELEPGHHRQGLAFGGENTPENIQFTGESTIRRSELDGIDTSFYHESGYGKKDAKILKIHKNENGLYIFGNNPDHTEVTNFQNKVLRWQKNEGLR